MDLKVQAFRLVQEATDKLSAEKRRSQAASKWGGLSVGRVQFCGEKQDCQEGECSR